MMLKWHFKKLPPDCPTDSAIAERNFRRESTELPEIFIRELLQNFLDARSSEHSEPLLPRESHTVDVSLQKLQESASIHQLAHRFDVRFTTALRFIRQLQRTISED